jgi:RNA polymerase sigma factor (sigma-70 family)
MISLTGIREPTSYPICFHRDDEECEHVSPDEPTDGPDFDALLGPHLGRLYRLAQRLTGSVADAEDLLQEVLLKLYERRRELSSIKVLAPWLCRVLYNQFLDDARQRKRQRLKLATIGDGAREEARDPHHVSAPEGRLFAFEEVHAALARLSVEHRTVLLMHDAEGYKLSEIQEITDVPVGTLKSRLHRARRRLREILDGEGTLSA